MTTYIANQSIGKTRPGNEVKGLTKERTKQLLECGAIRESDVGSDTSKELDKMNMTELKAYIAESGGEPVDGNKADLLAQAKDVEAKLTD